MKNKNMFAIYDATKILNEAIRKIYQLNISSAEIALLLEQYANNEKLQVIEDFRLND